jgi:serine phosphatase RsbU (regulator of sigma subunit)
MRLRGHPAILHYRVDSHDPEQLSMEHFPLGLIPGGHFASAHAEYALGEVFLMLTDGIPDTVNEKKEEFGLDRVEQILVSHARAVPRFPTVILPQ